MIKLTILDEFRNREAELSHSNIYPFALHLWRPHRGKIPLPPKEYV